MPIQIWSEGIWVVKLADEPALSEDLRAVYDKAQLHPRMPHIVLDFGGVTQVGSSNLSQLLRLRTLGVNREARLRLAAISDTVWAVLMTTGLEHVFECVPDVPTALAGLQIRN